MLRRSIIHVFCVLMMAAGLGSLGCSTSYVTPAGGVAPSALAEPDIQQHYNRKPASPFPALIAVARVQSPGYRSYSTSSYGSGRYSVVTTRDVETDEHFARLAQLPMVAGLTPLNRLIIPRNLESDRQLRQAAASVKADMLLLYTLDTSFIIEDHEIGPLATITLGFLPNKEARVTTTASAAFYDVRTGYIYGLAEATSKVDRRASAWSSRDAVEAARLEAEAKAFDQLVNEMAATWKGIVEQYAAKSAR